MVWSLNPAVISRFAQNEDPFLLATLRIFFGIMALTPVVIALGLSASFNSSMIVLLMVASAVLGPGLGDFLYVLSIQLIGGSLAVVVGYTYIFVSQFIAIAFLGEKFSFTLFIGTVLAFIGIVYAVKPRVERGLNFLGIIFGLISAFSWGTATALIKILQQYFDPISLTYVRLLVIAPLFLALTFARTRKPKRTTRGLLAASAYTGIAGWGIGMVLYIYSIYKVGVSLSVLATAMVPVLAQVNVRMITNERVGANNIIGALMVASAIALQSIRW